MNFEIAQKPVAQLVGNLEKILEQEAPVPFNEASIVPAINGLLSPPAGKTIANRIDGRKLPDSLLPKLASGEQSAN